MTTGSVIIDGSPARYYSKVWSGTNYPSTPPANLFQWVWKRVEDGSNTEAGKPRTTYLKYWEERRLKRRSTLVDHPYTMSHEMWSDDPTGEYLTVDPFPPYPITGHYIKRFREVYGVGFSSAWTAMWGNNDTIALQGKLREKIVGSDFDMGVFLGEGREALGLLAQTATRLYQAYRSFRGFDPAGVARALGAKPARVRKIMHDSRRGDAPVSVKASQAWLELQYGWLPLVKDAQGAAEALAQQLNEPAVQTYRVRRTVKTTKPAGLSSTNIKTYSYLATVRGQLIARLSEVNVAALNGLMDPSSVLWELTPWSFVADWFIPIGSYLTARGLDQAVTGVFVTTISRREKFDTLSGLPVGPAYRHVRGFDWIYSRITVDRTVSSSLSTPRPQFKSLDKVVSWTRAANAVALLVTGFSNGASGLSKGWQIRDKRIGRKVWD